MSDVKRMAGYDFGSIGAFSEAGGQQTAGAIEVAKNSRKSTDPEEVERRLAAERKIGDATMVAGQAVAGVGTAVPMPWGALVMAIGASIALNGMAIRALATKDPAKIAFKNAVMQSGKSETYAKEFVALFDASPERLTEALEKAKEKGGFTSGEREQAARDLLEHKALLTAQDTTAAIVTLQQSAQNQIVNEISTRNRIVLLVLFLLVILIIAFVRLRR